MSMTFLQLQYINHARIQNFFSQRSCDGGGRGGYFISLIILNNLFYYVKLFILNFQENKSLTSKLTISSYMYRPI